MTRVIEWLLGSPLRLVLLAAGAVMAVIVAVVGFTSSPEVTRQAAPGVERRSDAPTPVAPSTPPATPPSKAPSASPSPVEGHAHGEHKATPRRTVERAARAYLSAFHDPTGPDKAWRARIDALSTGTLAQLNASVPRAIIPPARIRTLTVDVLAYSYAHVTARMSSGDRLGVALVLDADGWKITEVAPEPESGL